MSDQEVKQKQLFTHVVQVPPNTDVFEMVGAYRALLESMNIDTTLLNIFPINNQGFSHPIEECKHVLTNDFMRTMQLLNASVADYGTVYLENFTNNGKSAVFVFYYYAG